MRRLQSVAFILAVTIGVPTVAQQEESQPYFSLSSNRTYSPGETPAIQLWADGVDKLQFRVYRVNDPVAFFRQLEDPHRFGGRAPARRAELTPLEKFHRWKLRLRARMRDFFRAQYTAPVRAEIRNWLAARAQKPLAPGAGATEYADVPLLNPQQVVAVWEQSAGSGGRWQAQVVPVRVNRKGLYLVEATDGRLSAYTIVSVTDIAILAKGAPGRVLARVVERASGAPVPGCQMIVLVNQKEAARLESSSDGLVEASLAEQRPETVTLLARRGEDFAASSLYGWALSTDPDRRTTGYVYTDRPVYRPGHQVRFRAILRLQTDSGYALPAHRQVQVEVDASDGTTAHRMTLPVSSFGTVHGDFTLAPTAPLGYYGISVRAGEAQVYGGFHVEEYRKPEYAVAVRPLQPRCLQGEPIQAEIEARYYYGEPVARAKVKYAVHRSRYWAGPPEEVEEAPGEAGYGEQEQVLEQEAELDADGKLTIRLENEPAEHDLLYRIEARVTDEANREITAAGYVLATVGRYRIEVSPAKYVFEPGEMARFQVAAHDYEGRPAAGVAFRLELAEHRWQQPEGPVLASVEGRTDNAGSATVEIRIPDRGSLIARAISATPEGRRVSDTAFVWVSSAGPWYATEQRVEIVPDKKSYAPGEVARVLIVTGVPEAHVWVTAEGRTVRESRFVAGKSSSLVVEVPVRAEYAPNFFVTAAFVRDGRLYLGSKSLNVPATARRLDVTLRSSKDTFQPGETGIFTLEAKDHQGRPAAAEFSIGVVDEAIYGVRQETLPEPVSFFYGRTYNRVTSDSSLSYYFYGEAGRRRMQLAGRRRTRMLAQLKPERLVTPKVRKAFPDTIYWVADLRTDAAGRAEARVTYPDALTSWRATARGVTLDTKVGSARRQTRVRKELILRLAAPRFFTAGDEVTIPAIVHNYLPSAKQVRVSLEAQGLEILEGGTRDIAVPSRGEGKVDYRVRALPGSKAVLLGKALTDEESDALELEMPVIPPGLKLSESRSGVLGADADSAEVVLEFPRGTVPYSRSVEISLTPSVAGAILGALEYLTSYPYGCTEQTMSSFLPNVLVSQAARRLKLQANLDEAELARKVSAGLARLYEFQHPDGGWGWWQTDDNDAFMTAYVLVGLKEAQAAGYPVRAEVVQRAAVWLKAEFGRLPAGRPDLAAYALVAAARGGVADRAMFDSVWRRRAELSPYGLALLGLALEEARDRRAQEAALRLESLAKSEAGGVYWEAAGDGLLGIEMTTSPEATAHALKLLSRVRPQSPLLEAGAQWLVRNRDRGSYWASTKQTALVIYGLVDYLALSRELQPDFAAAVEVNGKSALARRFGATDALAPAPVTVRLDAAALGESNRLKITKRGKGRLYWSLRSDYSVTGESPTPRAAGALSVRREYFKLVPVATGNRVVHRLEPLPPLAAPGDVIAVRLTLEGGASQYLLLEDPIPAGAEFISRADLYELSEPPPWWSFWMARREYRDDRATFYLRRFDESKAEFVYLLKIASRGRFQVNPTRVAPMYEPRSPATAPALTLEVR